MAANDAAAAGVRAHDASSDSAPPLVFAPESRDGRDLLVLENQVLRVGGVSVATLERLELEPFSGASPGGTSEPGRRQNRRSTLKKARLVTDLERLQAYLATRQLDDFGFSNLRLDVDNGELHVFARTRIGEREADFTARGYASVQGVRDVRLTLHALRIYGFLPVAAPLLARHLLAALGLDAATTTARVTPPPELAPSDGLLAILDRALLTLLPTHGWRLPDLSQTRLSLISVGEQLVLEWSDGTLNAESAVAVEDEAARARLWHAELLLGSGEQQRALDALREAIERDGADMMARHRLMQTLVADAATIDQAAVAAAETLSRAPDDPTAMLCGAVAAAERGDHAAAAAVLEHIGELDETAGHPRDAASSRFAAARERLAAGDEPAALSLLERAVDHPGAADLLRERLTAAERWPDLVRVLRRAALHAPAAQAQKTHLDVARIILERIGDFDQACVELEQATQLDNQDAIAWEELGRARAAAGHTTAALDAIERAIALAAQRGDRKGEARLNMVAATVSESAGDDQTALARLERAAHLDTETASPLKRAAEVEARLGHPEQAAELLERAAGRTPAALDRAALLRELALMLADAVGDFAAARLRMTQSLTLDPGAVDGIDQLTAVAERRGDTSEAESLMAWAADLTADPTRRRERLIRLRDSSRRTGNRATLRQALHQLAEAGGEEASASAVELGDLFLVDGDAHAGELAQRLYERLLDSGQPLPELSPLQIAQKLAGISERRGDDEAALRHLRLVLEHGAEGGDAADAWRRIAELHTRRGEIQSASRALIGLAEDARTGESKSDRAAALISAANLLRRRTGQLDDAASLYERALSMDGGCREALDALESLAEERNDAEMLAGVLERRAGVLPPEERRDVLLRLGDLQAGRLQHPERAHDAYLKVLEIDGHCRPALLFLAREAWLGHDVERTVELYRRLAEIEDGDSSPAPIAERAETHLRLATMASEQGHSDQAEEEVRHALELVPSSAPALDLLLQLLEARQAKRELADALAQRADVEPAADRRAELLRRRAALLEELGDRNRAAEARRDLASVRSSDPAVLLRIAHAQHEEGRLDELEQTLEQLRGACSQTGQQLPDEALLLQADAAESQGKAADALSVLVQLAARAQGAGADAQLRDVRHRAAALIATARLDTPSARELLEKAVAADPNDATTADALSWLYASISEPQARAKSITSLLTGAPGLSTARRAALHATLGDLAESAAEPERAEQAYRTAAKLEPAPSTRAGYMTAHARVLLARADLDGAAEELQQALALNPGHAGALAALADLSFRRQQWNAARDLYLRLEAVPDTETAAPREAIAFRLGLLAQILGDDAEAQRRFREVADIDPRHMEAREALAQIALAKRNYAVAAARLEEILRLISFDDLGRLRDVRQRLGEVYRKLGDLVLARHYLELVVAQDSARIAALELLVDVYERLEQYTKAADTCGRLAQLYLDPSQRAQVLFRQGEILRLHLGREAAAMDAYLKSSDLDPSFPPTLERLSGYFWRQGDFENLAEIGSELCRGDRHLRCEDASLPVRLAIAGALALGEPEAASAALSGAERDADLVSHALAEAAGHMDGRPAHELEPATAALFAWGGQPFADQVIDRLRETVLSDPAAPGPLRALAWACDRAGRNETARALYSLLAFVHRDQGGIGRLIEMGPAPAPRPEALAPAGPATHPDCAVPLASALISLAAPLEGFGWREPDDIADDETVSEDTGCMLNNLASSLSAPPFSAVLRNTTGAEQSPVLMMEPARPLRFVLNRTAETLPGGELLFLCARLFHLARAGVTSIAQLSAEEAAAVLSGAAAALSEGPVPEHPLAKASAAHLHEKLAELPAETDPKRLASELCSAASAMPSWTAFLSGAEHTANRIGLLVCGNPLGAWRALARFEGWSGGDEEAAQREQVARTSESFLELLRFVVDEHYESAYMPENGEG